MAGLDPGVQDRHHHSAVGGDDVPGLWQVDLVVVPLQVVVLVAGNRRRTPQVVEVGAADLGASAQGLDEAQRVVAQTRFAVRIRVRPGDASRRRRVAESQRGEGRFTLGRLPAREEHRAARVSRHVAHAEGRGPAGRPRAGGALQARVVAHDDLAGHELGEARRGARGGLSDRQRVVRESRAGDDDHEVVAGGRDRDLFGARGGAAAGYQGLVEHAQLEVEVVGRAVLGDQQADRLPGRQRDAKPVGQVARRGGATVGSEGRVRTRHVDVAPQRDRVRDLLGRRGDVVGDEGRARIVHVGVGRGARRGGNPPRHGDRVAARVPAAATARAGRDGDQQRRQAEPRAGQARPRDRARPARGFEKLHRAVLAHPDRRPGLQRLRFLIGIPGRSPGDRCHRGRSGRRVEPRGGRSLRLHGCTVARPRFPARRGLRSLRSAWKREGQHRLHGSGQAWAVVAALPSTRSRIGLAGPVA